MKNNSENLSKAKNIENNEKIPKVVQKEIESENNKVESKISLTSNNSLQEEEYSLDSYLKEDSNSDIYNEFEDIFDKKKNEEPNPSENTEIKEEMEIESPKNDFLQKKRKIISPNLSSKRKKKKKKIITINLYKQKLEKIIKIKPNFLFKENKQYTKKQFYKILKVNKFEKYIEKIKLALKEEKSKDCDEEDDKILNNDSSDIFLSQDLPSVNINEIINENAKSEIINEDSSLVKSLLTNNNFNSIFTNSLSTTNDEN